SVTVKAAQLDAALAVAPPEAVGQALVVPLLNGIDHVAVLRERYGDRVLPASMAVESERIGPGRVAQLGPFAIIALAPMAGADELAGELRAAGFAATVGDSDGRGLGTKRATLAPLAL